LKKILISMLTLVVLMFFVSSPATANGHKGEHVPVNVCHATNSDTNPYVFITVDDDSTKFQGHLAHRNEPNKTWKSDGTFNGVAHSAGDPKADLIQSYTDSDGVFHELDGNITSDSCVNHDTPPPADTEVTPVVFGVTPAECDVDGSLVIPAQPEGVNVSPAPGTYGPGTYTVTYTAEDGFVLTSDPSDTVTVDAATGDCPQPTKPQPVVTETSSTEYLCGDAFSTVTTTTTTTDWVLVNGEWVPGEPVVNTTTEQVAHEVEPCGHKPPKHHHHVTPPKHHANPPEHHNTVTHAAVPTEVEAGLASLDNAAAPQQDDHAGWLVLGGLAILGLAVLALRRSGN
jgi:hypothetical protein